MSQRNWRFAIAMPVADPEIARDVRGETKQCCIAIKSLAICDFELRFLQGPLNGGVSNGGASRSGLVLPFLSFFCLFRDFPDLLGDGPGIFPIRPFSLCRPIKSTYEE